MSCELGCCSYVQPRQLGVAAFSRQPYSQEIKIWLSCMAEESPARPDWDQLYETAQAQEGLFSTHQANAAGYSAQLLGHYLKRGRVLRVMRGIYRLVHFPAGEHEDLVCAWLWSEQAGVVSHQTALGLHGLSDVLAAKVHLSLPMAWRKRRVRVPEGVLIHHGDVSAPERAWAGPVPMTSVVRTLQDLAAVGLSPEVLGQAMSEALQRGLASSNDLEAVERALAECGGS